jgi:hypothetical protein
MLSLTDTNPTSARSSRSRVSRVTRRFRANRSSLWTTITSNPPRSASAIIREKAGSLRQVVGPSAFALVAVAGDNLEVVQLAVVLDRADLRVEAIAVDLLLAADANVDRGLLGSVRIGEPFHRDDSLMTGLAYSA